MNVTEYDILVEVNFFPADEGGRKGPTPENFFACPMIIRGKKYDCRLLLGEVGPILPGDNVTVPVKFLDFKAVSGILKREDIFELWEMGLIARGRVLEINRASL